LIRSIDWEAGQHAIRQLGLNRSLWIPKWLAGFLPVGKVLQCKVLQCNKLQDHAECPHCSNFETTTHVLLWNAPNTKRRWDASIATLDKWMMKALTLPDLIKAILSRLKTFCNQDEAMQEPSYTWPGINDLILAQDTIGWMIFMEGGLLQTWAVKQQEYFKWLQRQNSGKRWITTLIKKV
jgi:hypothetical protein